MHDLCTFISILLYLCPSLSLDVAVYSQSEHNFIPQPSIWDWVILLLHKYFNFNKSKATWNTFHSHLSENGQFSCFINLSISTKAKQLRVIINVKPLLARPQTQTPTAFAKKYSISTHSLPWFIHFQEHSSGMTLGICLMLWSQMHPIVYSNGKIFLIPPTWAETTIDKIVVPPGDM